MHALPTSLLYAAAANRMSSRVKCAMWRYEARYSRPATSALQTSRCNGRGDCWRGAFQAVVRPRAISCEARDASNLWHMLYSTRSSSGSGTSQLAVCGLELATGSQLPPLHTLARNLQAASPENKGEEAS